jgi:hypothetical protein
MSGAAAIYLEQGFDQFFKPGPGEHDFQLNPLGRLTEEFIRFAEKHPDRGTPYTPVAFLLDPANGWEMTDYPQWPFEVSQLNRSDRALRELFGVAYYPGLVVEGEPATGDRQAFVNGIFGDIFDVLVASDVQPRRSTAVRESAGVVQSPGGSPTVKDGSTTTSKQANTNTTREKNKWDYEGSDPRVSVNSAPAGRVTSVSQSALPSAASSHVRRSPIPILEAYRAVVVGGHIDWSTKWIQQLTDYVKSGGTVVVNAAQIKGLPADLLGIRLTGTTVEADSARCLSPGEAPQDLSGQMFRYEKAELKGAQSLITTESGDPLVTVNKVGKGSVVFAALPDLLGEDARITPFAAHMLAHVFADAAPVKVRGDVEYLINRTDAGWVVTLINNKGVYKPALGLAQVDRNEYVTATISLPAAQAQNAIDWISEKPVEVKNQNGEATVMLNIAPGGISIVELKQH